MRNKLFFVLSGLMFTVMIFAFVFCWSWIPAFAGMTRATIFPTQSFAESLATPTTWEIQAVDTMKTSRDRARNPLTDAEIQAELDAIKELGANYVAIDTPYDEEFIPHLTKWVTLARSMGLKVWFRGNWSQWEGWFGYPKDLSPEEHMEKTYAFVTSNPELFADGDIFDACPECENAQHWPQPHKDNDYNDFIRAQKLNNEKAFGVIGKDVYTNIPSIIGGRAKEVISQETADYLDNVVAIDHYIKDSSNMGVYVDYFAKERKSKVLVSEFGAPIPDINGPMTEQEQADFVDAVFLELYKKKTNVMGINYNVLNFGTTELLNTDGSKRKVYDVVKKYYSPGVVQGTISDSLGDPLPDITVRTSDGIDSTKSDADGKYYLVAVPRDITLQVGGGDYTTASAKITVSSTSGQSTNNFSISPITPEALYKIREFLKGFLSMP